MPFRRCRLYGIDMENKESKTTITIDITYDITNPPPKDAIKQVLSLHSIRIVEQPRFKASNFFLNSVASIL